jgi:signal peptidase II
VKSRIIFFSIAFVIIVADQVSKYFAQLFIPPNRYVPVIKGFFYLTYVKNTGAAFGIFAGQQIPLIIIGLLVCAIILYFHFKEIGKDYYEIPFGLVFGGSIGNLIDRIFRSYVIDFIDFRYWPAFNIADAAVNIGLLIIIFRLIFIKEDL